MWCGVWQAHNLITAGSLPTATSLKTSSYDHIIKNN